jgi:probable addiction module antidote protein
MKNKTSVSHDEVIIKKLRTNAKFAAEYLQAAMEDTDEPKVLLVALRHLAEAHGVAKIAKAAHVERESLYRALSPRGNPRLTTLMAVVKALGLSLSVTPTLAKV